MDELQNIQQKAVAPERNISTPLIQDELQDIQQEAVAPERNISTPPIHG